MNNTQSSTMHNDSQKFKRNHKDGIFRQLFNNEDELRTLYSALSGREYPEDTKVRIVTLENVIFGDQKNDLAFILADILIVLIDHQSTHCPNMPLRLLDYIAKEYERLYFSKDIYSSRLLHIPTPEFYVFYNGTEDRPLMEKMKLSDAFIQKCDTISLELVVTVINVNHEKGAEILEKSRTLYEYSLFIRTLRELYAELGDKQAAAEQCVKLCMKKGILADFLKRNGGDVVSFLFDELTREECLQVREKDAYLFGLEDGKADEQRATALRMLQEGTDHDYILRMTKITPEELQKLIEDHLSEK